MILIFLIIYLFCIYHKISANYVYFSFIHLYLHSHIYSQIYLYYDI